MGTFVSSLVWSSRVVMGRRYLVRPDNSAARRCWLAGHRLSALLRVSSGALAGCDADATRCDLTIIVSCTPTRIDRATMTCLDQRSGPGASRL